MFLSQPHVREDRYRFCVAKSENVFEPLPASTRLLHYGRRCGANVCAGRSGRRRTGRESYEGERFSADISRVFKPIHFRKLSSKWEFDQEKWLAKR